MNTVYLLAPLLGMLVFGGVYSKYARDYHARAAEQQQREAAVRAEKKAADEVARETALEAARVAQLRRNEERTEKARLEEQQRQERLSLEDRRNAAIAEAAQLRSRLTKLRGELEAVTTTVERSERQNRHLQLREHAVLDRTKRAEEERELLQTLLDRLESFELRRAAGAPSSARSNPDRG